MQISGWLGGQTGVLDGHNSSHSRIKRSASKRRNSFHALANTYLSLLLVLTLKRDPWVYENYLRILG